MVSHARLVLYVPKNLLRHRSLRNSWECMKFGKAWLLLLFCVISRSTQSTAVREIWSIESGGIPQPKPFQSGSFITLFWTLFVSFSGKPTAKSFEFFLYFLSLYGFLILQTVFVVHEPCFSYWGQGVSGGNSWLQANPSGPSIKANVDVDDLICEHECVFRRTVNHSNALTSYTIARNPMHVERFTL